MKIEGTDNVLRCGICLGLILFLSTNTLMAQSSRQKVTQPVSWASYTANIKTGKKTIWFVDTQFRFAASTAADQALEPMQYMLRSHLDFKITKSLSVAPLGGTIVWNFRYGKQPASIPNGEYRLYQQFMYEHQLGKLKVNHRLRTEERFIEEHDPVTGESTGHTNRQFRPRYRFLATLPLNNADDTSVKFSAQFFYEGFMSRGKKVTFHDVDQNRLFAGLTCRPVNHLTIGLGWFYQMLIKANGAKQENNFGTLITVTHSMNLIK